MLLGYLSGLGLSRLGSGKMWQLQQQKEVKNNEYETYILKKKDHDFDFNWIWFRKEKKDIYL